VRCVITKRVDRLRAAAAFAVALLSLACCGFLPSSFGLVNAARAAEPPGFGSWVKSAKLAGASLWTGMTQDEMNLVLTDMVNQHVTVI
jgi:hypothetical protein